MTCFIGCVLVLQWLLPCLTESVSLQAAPPPALPSYSITEIPMPSGAVSMQALSINTKDAVAGYYALAAGDVHGFVWSNNTLSTLPPLPGHSQTLARDISDGGVVVGYSGPTSSPDKAVVWTNGQPHSLGTLGGAWSAANGISSSGQVVGWAMVEPGTTRFHGFLYDGSSLLDVGLMVGGVATELNDINSSGMAVGNGQVIEGHFHAILVDREEGILDLGTLGGVTSEARAVSDAGHVVGGAQTGVRNDATFEGIERHAFLWHKGKMTDLGTLPGLIESRAMGVNSSGQVVGIASSADVATSTAFLWRRGKMTALESLLPPGSGWTLRTANAINESGTIVGEGLHDGQPRAFVMHPVMSAPVTGAR
ncbi:MAG TPA: hypothetical protein VFD43_13075 [Planctomycetota bacterium]|nr:hypothetical protein [Planctomycetota bacterium]